MTLPFISLNGTSANSLLDQNAEVYGAINNLLDKMSAAAPNGRDYGTEEFKAACDEFKKKANFLREWRTELEAYADHCFEYSPPVYKSAAQEADEWTAENEGTPLPHAFGCGCQACVKVLYPTAA